MALPSISASCARKAAGRVGLTSADPYADPSIMANFIGCRGRSPCGAGGYPHRARGWRCRAALAPYRGEEIWPGAHVQGDAEIDAWVRAKGETIYHPVGTAKMGLAGDPMAVVDKDCKVIGLEGLRVVDASVIPALIGRQYSMRRRS